MPSRFTIESVIKAVDKVSAPVRKMGRSISHFARSSKREMDRLSKSVAKVGKNLKTAAGYAARKVSIGFGLATAAVVSFTRQFSKIEDAEAAFRPMVGGLKNAQSLVERLNQTAASTPFQFEALAQSTKTLLGFGAATQDNVIPILRMLGDVSGGSSERLNRIAFQFGQIKAGGRAMGEDIRTLVENGVPLLAELADMWNVNLVVAKKYVEKGRATGAEVEKAFKRMTSAGGKFHQGMLLASQTTTGLWSTFIDNVNLAQAAIGKALSPVVKELIRDMTDVAKRVRAWAEDAKNSTVIAEKFKQGVEFIKSAIKGIDFNEIIATTKKLFELVRSIDFVAVGESITKAFKFVQNIDFDQMSSNLSKMYSILERIAGAAVKIGENLPIEKFLKFIDLGLTVGEKLQSFMASGGIAGAAFRGVSGFFRGDDNGTSDQKSAPDAISASPQSQRQMVTPQSRVARSIEETRSSTMAEVTIKDETGRAEVTAGTLGRGLSLEQSARF